VHEIEPLGFDFRLRTRELASSVHRSKLKTLAFILLLTGAMGALGALSPYAQQKRSTWDGVYTSEQEARGRAQYAESCASCHGPELETESYIPLIVGPAYIANWDGLPLATFFDRVRGMPVDKELTRQQNADVVAFLLARNGFPAGRTELKGQQDELNEITFRATRPGN